jgi:protein-L-isoaspartate(D-aspartate) O-methyltransferase
MSRLETFRACYAWLMTANAGAPADTSAVREALTAVPRERFLGPGPWQVVTPLGYVAVRCEDPAFLYQDLAFALEPDPPQPRRRLSVTSSK